MNAPKACPLCQSVNLCFVTDQVRFGRSGEILACRTCTHTFLNPASCELPWDFYEGAYHQSYLSHVEPSSLDPAAYFDKMLQASRPWADRFKALMAGGERVLDVGCSTGHFLTLIKDKAGAVSGHDLNISEVEFCRDTLGLDVSRQPVVERFAPGSFDFITLIYVLEHIKDPIPFLKGLKPLLKPDGKLVVLVPNADDPLVALYDIPEYRAFFYCQEHYHYFNRASLDLTLLKAGFVPTTQCLQEYPLANHLHWGFMKRPSDTLTARKVAPDLPLSPSARLEGWLGLWNALDLRYREFLEAEGLGDRLWSVATAAQETAEQIP